MSVDRFKMRSFFGSYESFAGVEFPLDRGFSAQNN